MAVITVIINKKSNVRKKIRERYRELYQGWKKENPNSRNYTLTKLNANIRNVLSVNGQSFNEQDFKPALIEKWSGRKVLPFSHWFFLVRFQADLFGNIYAIVEDACYEGDYHNDTMNTTPYGESIKRHLNKEILKEHNNNTMNINKKVIRLTESDLHNMITKAVKKILKEGKVVNNKPGFGEYTYGTRDFAPDARRFYKKKFGGYNDDYFDFEETANDKHDYRQNNKGGDILTDKKRWREDLIKMLRAMDITLEEYKNMSEEEQWDLEDEYEWRKAQGGRSADYIEADRPRWNEYGEYMGEY